MITLEDSKKEFLERNAIVSCPKELELRCFPTARKESAIARGLVKTRIRFSPSFCVRRQVNLSLVVGVVLHGCFLFDQSVTQKACGSEVASSTLWEITTRRLPSNSVQGPIQQMGLSTVENHKWRAANFEEFFGQAESSVSNRRTVIYVHGNWTSDQEARERGWLVYNRLISRTREPIRFVVYSWAADREDGFARDLKNKQERLSTESYYLASLLQQIPEGEPLSLLGFSFGGAVVCGALHLDAGGALSGRKLEMTGHHQDIRVSLTAPAFDRNSLGPQGVYRQALTNVDQVVNLYNSQDPILKRFRFINLDVSPVAAGFAGLRGPQDGVQGGSGSLAQNPKILQVDCGGEVGRTHAELAYYHECAYVTRALDNLLGF